jgi:hypothetical protein
MVSVKVEASYKNDTKIKVKKYRNNVNFNGLISIDFRRKIELRVYPYQHMAVSGEKIIMTYIIDLQLIKPYI